MRPDNGPQAAGLGSVHSADSAGRGATGANAGSTVGSDTDSGSGSGSEAALGRTPPAISSTTVASRRPGDEVLLPAATVTTTVAVGALPVLVGAAVDGRGTDPTDAAAKTTERTGALVAVPPGRSDRRPSRTGHVRTVGGLTGGTRRRVRGQKGAEGHNKPADHALGRSRGGLSTKARLAADGRARPLALASQQARPVTRPASRRWRHASRAPRSGPGHAPPRPGAGPNGPGRRLTAPACASQSAG